MRRRKSQQLLCVSFPASGTSLEPSLFSVTPLPTSSCSILDNQGRVRMRLGSHLESIHSLLRPLLGHELYYICHPATKGFVLSSILPVLAFFANTFISIFLPEEAILDRDLHFRFGHNFWSFGQPPIPTQPRVRSPLLSIRLRKAVTFDNYVFSLYLASLALASIVLVV